MKKQDKKLNKKRCGYKKPDWCKSFMSNLNDFMSKESNKRANNG